MVSGSNNFIAGGGGNFVGNYVSQSASIGGDENRMPYYGWDNVMIGGLGNVMGATHSSAMLSSRYSTMQNSYYSERNQFTYRGLYDQRTSWSTFPGVYQGPVFVPYLRKYEDYTWMYARPGTSLVLGGIGNHLQGEQEVMLGGQFNHVQGFQNTIIAGDANWIYGWQTTAINSIYSMNYYGSGVNLFLNTRNMFPGEATYGASFTDRYEAVGRYGNRAWMVQPDFE